MTHNEHINIPFPYCTYIECNMNGGIIRNESCYEIPNDILMSESTDDISRTPHIIRNVNGELQIVYNITSLHCRYKIYEILNMFSNEIIDCRILRINNGIRGCIYHIIILVCEDIHDNKLYNLKWMDINKSYCRSALFPKVRANMQRMIDDI
jgi:hypothetical protein